jgi:uncharacterized protein (TIGR02594 family)
MSDDTPQWLGIMRTITGMTETPGEADNPKILAMRDEIARIFPDMASYCAQYTGDEIPWCGLATAYCMALSGIRPPFGPTDTDKFLWAQSWASDPDYEEIGQPRPGCVVVLQRTGGGHVTFYERTEGRNYVCRGGNQSDSINTQSFPISSVIKLVWPRGVPLPIVPVEERRMIKKGDVGPEVERAQLTLGIPVDGDFGSVTDAQVKSYQAAAGLVADGVVGPATWAELDALDVRKAAGNSKLSADLMRDIIELAENSPLATFDWPDRGRAPSGYVAGMALAFALAATELANDDPSAAVMAQADTGNPDADALTWYREEFERAGMDNSEPGIDTLRHLFVLMIGLGMRESSGRYCEGRDVSASNVTADTAEAGLFQASWNIRAASPQLPPLLTKYWNDPNGFLAAFAKSVAPKATDLQGYGSGDGARYQWLAKYCPAFACMVAGIGLRCLRKHWGPINRREVTIEPCADDLLYEVQVLVEAQPAPEPVPPEPEVAEVVVDIKAKGNVRVTVYQSEPGA